MQTLDRILNFLTHPLVKIVLGFAIFFGVLWYKGVLWIVPMLWDNSGGLNAFISGFGLTSVYVLIGIILVIGGTAIAGRANKEKQKTMVRDPYGHWMGGEKGGEMTPKNQFKFSSKLSALVFLTLLALIAALAVHQFFIVGFD